MNIVTMDDSKVPEPNYKFAEFFSTVLRSKIPSSSCPCDVCGTWLQYNDENITQIPFTIGLLTNKQAS